MPTIGILKRAAPPSTPKLPAPTWTPKSRGHPTPHGASAHSAPPRPRPGKDHGHRPAPRPRRVRSPRAPGRSPPARAGRAGKRPTAPRQCCARARAAVHALHTSARCASTSGPAHCTWYPAPAPPAATAFLLAAVEPATTRPPSPAPPPTTKRGATCVILGGRGRRAPVVPACGHAKCIPSAIAACGAGVGPTRRKWSSRGGRQEASCSFCVRRPW